MSDPKGVELDDSRQFEASEVTAVCVYHEDQWNDRRLKDLRVERRDVISEMRQKGLRGMDQVETVVIEHNGGISLIGK